MKTSKNLTTRPDAASASPIAVLDPSAGDASGSVSASPISILAVEYRDVELLIPYARNARLHDDAHVVQIAASIREWGWTMPVLIDEHGGIIAGHGRVLAARKLNMLQVPVIVARGWSEAKKRAYILADNKLTENSKWDRALLSSELAELASDFNLSLIGFSSTELGRLLESAAPLDAAAQLEGLVYHIIVDCTDEQHQIQVLDKLQQEGFTCRALIA